MTRIASEEHARLVAERDRLEFELRLMNDAVARVFGQGVKRVWWKFVAAARALTKLAAAPAPVAEEQP